MSSVKKLNALVADVFGQSVENINEVWTNNPDVQKQLKSIVGKNTLIDHKKKDPNAPKRGKSAYLFFCADHRDAVKTDLGNDAKATEVTKELGIRWNALKDSKAKADKTKFAKYEKLATEDKARYEAEKAEYVPIETEETGKTKRRGGKKNDEKSENSVKRATSAYLYFCADHRDSIKQASPDMKATEVTSELGRMWNELKNDPNRSAEYKKYEKLAAEDKVRYETDKAAAAAADSENDPEAKKTKKAPDKKPASKKAPVKGKKTQEVVEEDVEEEVELVEEDEEKPATKPVKSGKGDTNNSYQAFCAARRPELKAKFPKLKAGDITKKLGAEWKGMSAEEQGEWGAVAATE